jgi:hypothetical protein
MLESTLEKKVCTYAKSQGFLVYKFVSPAQRGVPDRIFLYNSQAYFFEFKTKKGYLSELQKVQIAKLVKQQFPVFVVDDPLEGMQLVDEIIKNNCLQ